MREDKGGIVKVIEINKFREKEIGFVDGLYEHLSVDGFVARSWWKHIVSRALTKFQIKDCSIKICLFHR